MDTIRLMGTAIKDNWAEQIMLFPYPGRADNRVVGRLIDLGRNKVTRCCVGYDAGGDESYESLEDALVASEPGDTIIQVRDLCDTPNAETAVVGWWHVVPQT